jgi:hypothetical protein
MEKKKVEIEIKNNLDSVNEKLDDVVGKVEEVAQANKEANKSFKEAEKSASSLAKGFSGIGLAIKAMGIGLLMKGFELLSDAFARNQKVADALSTIFETISITLNQVTNIVVGVIEKVSKSSKGFEGLTNVIKGLMTLALTPLKAAFYGIGVAISEIQLAWEQSLFGDKDPKQITVLIDRLNYFKAGLRETRVDAVEAGKNIASNLGKAVSEIGQVVQGSIEGISKIDIEANKKQAENLVKLRKAAQIAVAEQQGLVEKYDREAELKRQIRDDESKSIADRKKANTELGQTLEKQRIAMTKLADLQVEAADAEVKALRNQANLVAYQESLNNQKAVAAQITGLESEQKVNAVALTKEELELQKSINDGKVEALNVQEQFNADSIKNDESRLASQRKALEEQRVRDLANIQQTIDSYNEGTQARADAETAFLLKKTEIDNAIAAKDVEIKNEALNRQYAFNELVISNERSAFQAQLEALDSQNAIIREREYANEAERTQALKDNTDKRIAIERSYKDARIAAELQFVDASRGAINALGSLFEQGTDAAKAAALADIAIGTATGFIQALDIAQKGAKASGPAAPFAFPIFYASQIAAVLGAAGRAKSVLESGNSNSGGGSSAPASASIVPNFNVVGSSGVNQIAQTLGRDLPPVKAYVVANDVTSAQSLNRNIVSSATLG